MKLVMSENSLLPLFQRITAFVMIFFIALTIMPAWGFSAYAEENGQAEETEQTEKIKYTEEWGIGYEWKNDTSEFSLDFFTKYAGKNSIKIKNTDYNVAYVERTFSVKPHTLYKFSAMARYDGLSVDPEEPDDVSGANIGIAGSYDHSEYVTDSKWTKIEYVFDSKEQTEITLALSNGMFRAACKGTAWFSDIKLEENTTEKTNEWRILAVIFKDVKVPVVKDGQKYTYTHSLTDDDIEYLKEPLKKLYSSFETISDGQMKVTGITAAVPDTTLTSLQQDDYFGYRIEPYDPQVSKVLDHYLAKKVYNQIIVISPIAEIAVDWGGLGGSKYKGVNFCQINYKSGNSFPGDHPDFPEAIYVHEMLHCMEADSRDINPDKTASLHGQPDYGFEDTGDEWKEWYTAYMRSELPDGKGLDPSVFLVYNEYKYAVVSDDMKVSDQLEHSSELARA